MHGNSNIKLCGTLRFNCEIIFKIDLQHVISWQGPKLMFFEKLNVKLG